VDRDDVHQIIAYMKALHVQRGGFIAPLEQRQEKVPSSHLKDSDATMSIFGIEICKEAMSYPEFCEKMKVMEQAFVESLQL